jgi:hypothetical protein
MVTPLMCRVCGGANDDATHTGSVPRVPHDGDYSLCAYCGTWSIFERGELRAPTIAEAVSIANDPACADAERVCKAVRAKLGRS